VEEAVPAPAAGASSSHPRRRTRTS
jgi:hypothetical protein